MSKQDRQGARTLAELMSRYNFGKTFAEIMGIATDAQKTAEKASDAVSSLDGSLDHDEIFNRLTKNGTLQGLYRGDDGELYVNATFVKSGKISSDLIDGSTLTITKGASIAGWNIDDNSIYKTNNGNWATGTFMCSGSSGSYSIGGSATISGWVFGAGGRYGVTYTGEVYCSALHATNGCKLGAWYIADNCISSTPTPATATEDFIRIEPTRLYYSNYQGMYTASANWEDVIKAANSYTKLEERVAALEK
jgi:hypothetical protein